jgi:hypothetical protein
MTEIEKIDPRYVISIPPPPWPNYSVLEYCTCVPHVVQWYCTRLVYMLNSRSKGPTLPPCKPIFSHPPQCTIPPTSASPSLSIPPHSKLLVSHFLLCSAHSSLLSPNPKPSSKQAHFRYVHGRTLISEVSLSPLRRNLTTTHLWSPFDFQLRPTSLSNI